MELVWPNDVFEHASRRPEEPLRPFHCLILMPFGQNRFEQLAGELKRVVEHAANALLVGPGAAPWEAKIERLDWVTSSGIVQSQLWRRIDEADLIFCDVTGHNPNVMFEAGVCAARKRIEQVVFLRDAFFRPEQPFDVSPFRYIQYQMTSEGIPRLHEQLQSVVRDAVVGFPDRARSVPEPQISLPLEIDFSNGHDDERLITAPLAHRQLRDGHLEFGSMWSFSHSWATVGRKMLSRFSLEFDGSFARLHPDSRYGYIGVGFWSQNPLMPFGSVLYLNRDGSIVLALPDDSQPKGYVDQILRAKTEIEPASVHRFGLRVSSSVLAVDVDDLHYELPIGELPKVLGAGRIRFQAHMAWMGIRRLSLEVIE